MGRKEKLIERFKGQPTDFTFDELLRLFSFFGFKPDSKGKTSGSRVRLINKERKMSYNMHRPHPGKRVKSYAMKQALQYLLDNKLIGTK